MLVVAQVVVSGVTVAGVAVDVVSDVTVERRGLGCEEGGGGSRWGSMSRLGSVCRRFRGAGGGFGAGGEVVVVVDDGVVVVDAGRAGVVTGDVATLGVGGEPVTKAMGSSSVWVAVSVIFVVVCILNSTPSAICVVWEAVSSVLGAAWVLASFQVVVLGSVWVSASSSRTAPRRSARAWAAIVRQSPAPCPSVSHFRRSSSFPFSTPRS